MLAWVRSGFHILWFLPCLYIWDLETYQIHHDRGLECSVEVHIHGASYLQFPPLKSLILPGLRVGIIPSGEGLLDIRVLLGMDHSSLRAGSW